jgi:hypothetical protein
MITEDLEDVVTYEEHGFSTSQPNMNHKPSRGGESQNQATTTYKPTVQSNTMQHKSIFSYRKKFHAVSINEIITYYYLECNYKINMLMIMIVVLLLGYGGRRRSGDECQTSASVV